MGTKPDFAQKLLHDLRLRKERMVTAQNSDAFGNSRQILKGSRETRTLETALNQMVSYGSTHHSRQTGDFSMALAYAFDFTSNHAMIGFLQKIAKRSMQQSPNTQWQSSTNQFPTLTHLHIDEIAKGAQKLNQILRACSSDLNIDKGSIEMGKELWKGAMELEQSLKMLVSLQEASECMARPQRKSHLKLLEVGEDSEDESPISTKKQKQVERPVFSFDKASKSSKGSVKTGKQQKLMALTYLKEAPSSKPETVATTAKHTHRRSASCGPEFQSSQHINSRKMKHNKAKIPNVIAKLMGLDELAENVRTKVATESHTISKQRSGEVVSTKKAYGKGSAEVKIEHSKNVEMQGMQNGIGIQSNKITNMKSHQPEPQKEEYQMTYNYSYRTTIDPQKPRSSEEDREAPRNHLKESQEAIFQINELQSQITKLNQYATNQKDMRKQIGVKRQKQEEVKDVMETLQTMVEVRNRSSEAAGKMQVQTLSTWNAHETEKKAAKKPLLQQQKQQRESQLQQIQVLSGYGTQGKIIKSEVRSQQRAKDKSELQKSEGKSKKPKNSQSVPTNINKLLKQPPFKQPNSAKENNAKANALPTSQALEGGDQYEVPVSDGNCIISDTKQKSSISLKPEQNSTLTGLSEPQTAQACVALHKSAKLGHLPAKRVIDGIKPQKISSPIKTNKVTTRTVKTVTKTARALKTQKLMLQKKVDKISISEVSHGNNSMSQTTQIIPANAEPDTQASQQKVDAEQMPTTNNPIIDESHCQETVVAPSDKSRDSKTTGGSEVQHAQQIVPHELQEVRSQRTATEGDEDSRNICYDLRPVKPRHTKMEKQDPLTEDEMYLKQKLIISNLFLNTAEALFKLNIPISVLNYASDQICEEKDSKLVLDCGYEVLKRKGRKQEIHLNPRINKIMSHTTIRSLDDLVRQLHKDFETLRSYGINGRDEYDDADYLLKMLERDIHYRDPDLNCMWDLGWNEMMFAIVEMDEVTRDVEREVLEELVDEIAKDCMSSSVA